MQKIQATVKLSFVRGGISAKSGRPYLSVSNGMKEFFVDIPKDNHGITDQTFDGYEYGDELILNVLLVVGSETVEFVSVE